ncbi:peptidase S41 [Gemmatirosa kalamazoonensis]|uniref:Peptidase S41 n=1 Tax=Gemmatirosa kalamazoonensis TaxID=861299 RepID=W0RCB5_9BACT|nr:S41 family peptidase [Gemmatirosa kalamazoonensis]AHG88092.1 peptidase S41 [Gemmatirosa kalamazoonensis]
MRRAALIAAGLLVGAPLAAQATAGGPVRARSAYEDLQMFSQVLNQIRVNHPDSLDTHELLVAAIEGMVRAADPHSFVIPAVRLVPGKEEQLRAGKLVPVPVDFTFVGGAPVVASVAAGTAASRLDILPGDELVSIDGQHVLAESSEELAIALAGAKESEVALGIERRRQDGSLVRLERRVRRERSGEATAVPVAVLLDSTTGYVRVTTFMNERVAEDLHDALGRLEKQGMTRLVLDLRDNGGGSVAEAAHVAGEFLPNGAIVYTAEGRKAETTDTGRVSRSFWRSERRYPIVVMVNGGTASASELVAGALQDHDRALVVGRPSFGKSLLMRGFPLSDGSIIELVVGRVRTPCGRVVQREYRTISRHEYYRLASADRDTAGRPSCRTDAGRVVYGGGGVYPDVPLDPAPDVPAWATRVAEQSLVLAWVGGYVEAHATALASLDAFLHVTPSLPAEAIADFRAFAAKQGVAIPTDTAADARLQRALVRAVAAARWGEAGWYRADAQLDPQIGAAVRAFGQAAALAR